MQEDWTETKDLSSENSELHQELIDKWKEMAYETKVWPKGEESFSNPVDK